MSRKRVVATGMGVISPFGHGIDIYEEKLFKGESQTGKIKSFDASNLKVQIAAECPFSDDELDELVKNKRALKTIGRAGKFLMIAAQDAYKQSGLDPDTEDPTRIGTSVGAGGLGNWDVDQINELVDIFNDSAHKLIQDQSNLLSNILAMIPEYINPITAFKFMPNIPTAQLAIEYNAQGNSMTQTTACTSSTQAIGEAFKEIRNGYADVMIAGGSDSMINPISVLMFNMLGVLSTNNDEPKSCSRPFDKTRDGFVIGEGGAMFILEELEHCKKRGGNPLFEISGYGGTSDAFRLTDPPPSAWGGINAMNIAIKDAGITTERIDYINAHGTSTVKNDRSETYAIKQVFGDHSNKTPVSSTKSMIGHGVAAAGALELVASVLALENQMIPPTANYHNPDPNCDLDYVPNDPRESRIDNILTNSFGFGSQNACLIINRI